MDYTKLHFHKTLVSCNIISIIVIIILGEHFEIKFATRKENRHSKNKLSIFNKNTEYTNYYLILFLFFIFYFFEKLFHNHSI